MIEARSDPVKSKLHRNLECQIHESREIGSGQTRDSKSERRHSKNQRTKNGLEWVNLTQMTIISTTVSKNLLEEME